MTELDGLREVDDAVLRHGIVGCAVDGEVGEREIEVLVGIELC